MMTTKIVRSEVQLLLSVLIVATLVSITGCGAGASPVPDEVAQTRKLERTSGSRFLRGVAIFADAQVIDKFEMSRFQERTVIKRAIIWIKSDSSEVIHDHVMQIATSMGGYMVESGREKTKFRIPADQFDRTIDSIETLGKVLDKYVFGSDVTDQYRDLEVRLDNALKTRDRYLALLEKANSVSEMLEIEVELERLNENIEILKGQLQELSHLTEFATVTVHTKKPLKRGILGEVGYQIYRGVSWLFVRH